MRPLHHPTTSLVPSFPPQRLGLFAPGTDVCGEPELREQLPHRVVVVPLVQTHPLRLIGARLGAFDGDTLDGRSGHLEVVAVGPVHGHADRDAMALDQEAPLDPQFGSIGRVFARLFPPQGVPWSCTRPCSTRTSRSPSVGRTPAVRPSRVSGTHRLAPTPGTGRVRWNLGRGPW